MAELSTLSPSPPALGDPHTAPSIPPSSSVLPAPNIPPSESAREIATPKSSLYNDKALTGHSPTAQSGGSPLTPHSPSSPLKLTTESPITLLGHDPAPEREASVEKDAETGAHIIKQETVTSDPAGAVLLITETETPALSSEPSLQSEVPLASPSPELNSGPNLYPNVHVTHNPNPVMEVGQLTAGQPQAATASNPMSGSPASTNTAAAAAAEEEKPQPLQQAQTPQSHPPPPSPKPDTPSDASKADLPITPTIAEHPSPTIPLIHEPAFVLPLPKPRPAPDTLSYLESASLMSGTLESLSGLGDDGSSVGSDSEINGLAVRRTDKYGFLGGSQYSESG